MDTDGTGMNSCIFIIELTLFFMGIKGLKSFSLLSCPRLAISKHY